MSGGLRGPRARGRSFGGIGARLGVGLLGCGRGGPVVCVSEGGKWERKRAGTYVFRMGFDGF